MPSSILPFNEALLSSIHQELSRPYGYGCVTYSSQGSHKDMTWQTFHASANAIVAGLQDTDWACIQNFADLRRRGQLIERQMFRATQGINTHKGLLFLILFLAQARIQDVSWSDCSLWIQAFSKPVARDYVHPQQFASAHYYEEGIKDIRQIPLTGFSALFSLEEVATDEAWDDNRLTLYLLAHVDDTTTIHRSDLSTLRYVQSLAKEAFNGKLACETLDSYYQLHHLSSGGVADIFVVVNLLKRLKKEWRKS